jgi:hypothetical protein
MLRAPTVRARWIAAVLAMLAVSASGCVVNEPESPPRGVVVSGPPPAPVREERPPPPDAQAMWVSGYWHWTGMQYAWIPGHWEAPPAGARWAAPRVTTLKDGRYVYEAGGWRSAPPERGSARGIR